MNGIIRSVVGLKFEGVSIMKITVIVPIYNGEKFISRCFESVINQTYINWELIAVDDGSVDSSWDIMSKYANVDDRIKIFKQKNSGAGMARNFAIQHATGDYIVFVDIDDYFSTEYFKLLSSHNEDVVFIDVNRVKNGEVIYQDKLSNYKNEDKSFFINSQITGKIGWAGWKKAAKTNLIKEYNIFYTSHKVGEEALYSFMLLHYARTIGFIESYVYFHDLRDDSLSQTILEDPWGDVAVYLKDNIIKMGLYDVYAETLNAFILTATIISLDKIVQIYDKKTYKIKAIERLNQYNSQIDKGKKINKRFLTKKALLMLPFIKLRCVRIFRIISVFKNKKRG